MLKCCCRPSVCDLEFSVSMRVTAFRADTHPCGFSAFWPPFTQTQLRGGTRVLPASVDEGRAASAAVRPKYIFLIQLPLRCEEKTCFFKPIRRPGEHNFYI